MTTHKLMESEFTAALGLDPTELMKQWKRRVYFDQQGVLTRRLHIRHVPAIVS